MKDKHSREIMSYDVVIVGAGCAGLSTAIRLKQLKPEISVCVIEKGSEVGAHILSGGIFEPRALNELIPDWKEKDAPLNVPVTEDRFYFLIKNFGIRLPTPPSMHNKGNYIFSLSLFSKWLAQQAENLGVEIYAGFAAAEILIHTDGSVKGVATGYMGLDKQGKKTNQWQPGIELHARQTVFAEGCRGSLTNILFEKFNLRKKCDPQTYGLGIKELWEIPAEKHKQGLVIHTIGWPMDMGTYGGSWMYHQEKNIVSIGFVIGLDYKNPHLSPFEEMQRMKLHPIIRKYLEGGRRISYGARTLSEGGMQSIPKLTFPGGLLVGDTAGFLNMPKIKGTHTAMKSGMLAAEALDEMFKIGNPIGKECIAYSQKIKTSWIKKELKTVRNIRPSFHFGLLPGLIYSALDTYIFHGKVPWTFKNHADHITLKKASKTPKISYSKPDGILTFDRLSSVFLSNISYKENQPCHIRLKDPNVPICINLPEYNLPEVLYCPAGVYEIMRDEKGAPYLQINAQNCMHCKTCDIKDFTQNIVWSVPQGGDGPNFSNM